MTEVELTKLSSKGQVVIPRSVRDELDLKEGETFAVVGNEDSILLKRVELPSKKELFEKVHKWGVSFAKKKGIREEDLQSVIKRNRGWQ